MMAESGGVLAAPHSDHSTILMMAHIILYVGIVLVNKVRYYSEIASIFYIQAWEFSGFHLISGILPVAKYLKSGKNLTLINEIHLYTHHLINVS